MAFEGSFVISGEHERHGMIMSYRGAVRFRDMVT